MVNATKRSAQSAAMTRLHARSPTPRRHVAQLRVAGKSSCYARRLVRSRSTNFWILPVDVLGNAPKTTVRGTL